MIMRYALIGLVLTIGTAIGINAINTVSNMQDAKMQRMCKVLPQGASYDEMCQKYRN
tara:strand:+ start:461 stop:631 length:171 start_codon:yes stop_codon:yes gene_type:complete